MGVKIQILFSEGCIHTPPTVDLIKSVASQLSAKIDLQMIEVTDAAQAEDLSFLGSPTVRIGGQDIDPAARGAKFGGFG